MFSYCKNNAVNMSDANGNRPEFSGTGHDTGEDLEVSLAIMNNRYDYSTGTIRRPGSKSKSSSGNKTVSKISSVTGSSAGSAILTGGDSWSASKITQQWEKNIFVPESFSVAARDGMGAMYAATKLTKFTGLLGIAGFGIGVWDNFANYKHGFARTFVDGVTFAAACGIGVAVGVFMVPGIIATGVCMSSAALLAFGGSYIKDKYFN